MHIFLAKAISLARPQKPHSLDVIDMYSQLPCEVRGEIFDGIFTYFFCIPFPLLVVYLYSFLKRIAIYDVVSTGCTSASYDENVPLVEHVHGREEVHAGRAT